MCQSLARSLWASRPSLVLPFPLPPAASLYPAALAAPAPSASCSLSERTRRCQQFLRRLQSWILAAERDDCCTFGRRPTGLGPFGVADAEDGPAPSQVVTRIFRTTLAHCVDLEQHRSMSLEAACPTLVECGGDHADEMLETLEIPAVVERLFAGMPCPARILSRQGSQVPLHGDLVRLSRQHCGFGFHWRAVGNQREACNTKQVASMAATCTRRCFRWDSE